MNKPRPRTRIALILLVIGLAFLIVGYVTDQTIFSWIAIAFVSLSLILGGKWLRRRR